MLEVIKNKWLESKHTLTTISSVKLPDNNASIQSQMSPPVDLNEMTYEKILMQLSVDLEKQMGKQE